MMGDREQVFLIKGREYVITRDGFIKQLRPKRFPYTAAYNSAQSTTATMAGVRIGYLLAHVSYERLRMFSVLELGPGAGVFFDALRPMVREMRGLDIGPSRYSTVTMSAARAQSFDMLCAFDVIEHFHDIDDLWKFDFKYGYLSFPCVPAGALVDRRLLGRWRHFKPDEHIYYLPTQPFVKWITAHDYEVVSEGCPEDCLRTRWSGDEINIGTWIIKRRA
jgi:hypothetical protein